jgi:hypothetical protein
MSFEPLAPELYRRLERHFDKVLVANPGEARVALAGGLLTPPEPQGLLGPAWLSRRRDNLPRPSFGLGPQFVRRGETYRVPCPYCGDSKFRLYVSYLWGEDEEAVVCYNETNCMAKPHLRQHLRLTLFGTTGPVGYAVRPGKEVDPTALAVEPPGDVEPITASLSKARTYLWSRGYTDSTSETELHRHFGVGRCTRVDDSRHHRRLVAEERVYIPVVQDGDLVGWQARYPDDLDWKQVPTPKYYNMPGMATGRVLYNYDQASHYDDVVLVEGVFDVWRVGPQGLGLLGSKLTAAKRLRLLRWRQRGRVAVCLDGEAWELTQQIAHDLQGLFGERAFPVRLPEGVDPDDMPWQTLWGCIELAANARGLTNFRRVV